MKKDFYEIEGYHCTLGQMIKNLQTVANNLGEDSPCFYTITTIQDTIRWGENTLLSEDIAKDIVNDLWFYSDIREMIRKVIINELNMQLEKRNLTLDDFEIK